MYSPDVITWLCYSASCHLHTLSLNDILRTNYIYIISIQIDPVVEAAVRSSGLDMSEIKSYLPSGLTIWIDPREVSYRVGEYGYIQVGV